MEAMLWSGALLSLAFLDANAPGHFSLCLFKNLGITFCPGCGLGHAIAFLYHGQISASIAAHPLGIPAVAVLIYRIFRLTQFKWQTAKVA